MVAINSGHKEIVELLNHHGANCYQKDQASGSIDIAMSVIVFFLSREAFCLLKWQSG